MFLTQNLSKISSLHHFNPDFEICLFGLCGISNSTGGASCPDQPNNLVKDGFIQIRGSDFVVQLVIPGSGLETGTQDAKRESLPEYAGVMGVKEFYEEENDSVLPQTNENRELPPFSGTQGVSEVRQQISIQ